MRKLVRDGYTVLVQPSKMRIFTDEQYLKAGATLKEDISAASLILGIKEVPVDDLIPERTYMLFSHATKGQEGNMKLLDAILEKKIRLIDYERIVVNGKRAVGFGYHAGCAGMIDLLRGLGDRLLGLGYTNPFLGMGYTDYYYSLAAAKTAIALVGNSIQINGVPKDHAPFIFGFTGDGKVTSGAVEIFRELPHEFIKVSDLQEVIKSGDRNTLYGLKIGREDYAVPIDPTQEFSLPHYRASPHLYKSVFHERIAPHLTALVNGMYWESRFPRLLTNDQMRELHNSKTSRLLAIADISADIRGSIEFTKINTKIDQPFVVYNPNKGSYDYKFVNNCTNTS